MKRVKSVLRTFLHSLIKFLYMNFKYSSWHFIFNLKVSKLLLVDCLTAGSESQNRYQKRTASKHKIKKSM